MIPGSACYRCEYYTAVHILLWQMIPRSTCYRCEYYTAVHMLLWWKKPQSTCFSCELLCWRKQNNAYRVPNVVSGKHPYQLLYLFFWMNQYLTIASIRFRYFRSQNKHREPQNILLQYRYLPDLALASHMSLFMYSNNIPQMGEGSFRLT